MNDAEDPIESILDEWDLGTIAEVRGIGCTGHAFAVTTARGGSFILKRNADAATAATALHLLTCLSARGLPVPTLLPTRDGRQCVTRDGVCFYLAPRLPGRITEDHYGPGAEHRAAAFGEAIARLHQALARCDEPSACREFDLVAELHGPIKQVLCTEAARDTWRRIEHVHVALAHELEGLVAQLPKQIVHRDAHPGNMLFDGERVSGYLDFDMVRRCVRIYDLAYCSTAMLMGGFSDPSKRPSWLALLRELVRGYESTSRLTPVERGALPAVQLMIELDFIAFHCHQGRPRSARENVDALLWLYENRDAVRRAIDPDGRQ